ncbi:hypothetical protein PGH26_03030 [Sporosarcina jeotgali]|uniref:Uncharacterized protein n=1 Tax=Sporosarcina jeotgali TaxID=3020056 RepID=A0ABZ0KY51_9BACL|nr:hypothetical protein [Sporosarcina sp. B2O-1]WOV84914.1 hypothetical protein PGH26_03030 [Sporosarcina sp. B2O-1]
MREFKITYFFDEEHYIRRFVHFETADEVIALLASERDRTISFWDSREIYHELNTANVRVIQFSEYHRDKFSEDL